MLRTSFNSTKSAQNKDEWFSFFIILFGEINEKYGNFRFIPHQSRNNGIHVLNFVDFGGVPPEISLEIEYGMS